MLPVGDAFLNLPYSTTRIPKKELEKFLSLAYSYFDNLQVRYQDFRLAGGKEELAAQPSLAFERIDPENSLYLRVTHTLPGFDLDLLDRYEISSVARLNEMERTIVLRELSETDTDELLDEITQMLRKHKKGKRGLNFGAGRLSTVYSLLFHLKGGAYVKNGYENKGVNHVLYNIMQKLEAGQWYEFQNIRRYASVFHSPLMPVSLHIAQHYLYLEYIQESKYGN